MPNWDVDIFNWEIIYLLARVTDTRSAFLCQPNIVYFLVVKCSCNYSYCKQVWPISFLFLFVLQQNIIIGTQITIWRNLFIVKKTMVVWNCRHYSALWVAAKSLIASLKYRFCLGMHLRMYIKRKLTVNLSGEFLRQKRWPENKSRTTNACTFMSYIFAGGRGGG